MTIKYSFYLYLESVAHISTEYRLPVFESLLPSNTIKDSQYFIRFAAAINNISTEIKIVLMNNEIICFVDAIWYMLFINRFI